MTDPILGRRELIDLAAGTLVAVAAGSLALPAAARPSGRPALVAMLSGAIDKERRAIWVYRTAAGTGVLGDANVRLAAMFMAQHAEHADALAAVVRKLGGRPPGPRKTYDLTTFNPDLATERGILMLALKLESDAVKAYYVALRALADPGLRDAAAGIFADEAMHVAVLRGALGLEPVPVAFVKDPTVWPMS